MTAAAYPATMTTDPCLRGETTSHSNFWSNYNGSAHLSNRFSAAMDGFHGSTSASPLPGRLRTSHDPAYSYGRCSQDEPAPYDRHLHPSLSTQSQHTFPSLKRPFSQTEPAAYQEMVQDLRDEGSRLTVNQDHKLLSFRRSHDKHTIVDQQGRIQQLELSAQLHGMFFLSEMPSTASDGSTLQPELTCYRRNLFQISGSLVTPRGQLAVVNEGNESVAISSMEVAISAIESVDGNPVRLIVIPWKTPPPNAPDISQTPDQEPSSLPLIPFQGEGSDHDGEYAVYPVGWRRLQFRIATANNGRRKELQQHFVLHLKVLGTLSDSSKVVLSEATTAPIVVRGRSPRNFQARKEIPLLGSSAGSRGQALVETGLGVVAGALSVKPQGLKRSVDLQVPRSNFTFGPPKALGASQLSSMRSSAFPSWSPNSNTPMPQMTTSSPGSYSSASIGNDPYPKVPLSASSNFSGENQELPLQTSIPSLNLSLGASDQSSSSRGPNSYTYAQPSSGSHLSQLHIPTSTSPLSSHDSSLSVPRYVDGGRPSKSSRSTGQQSVHSNGSSSPSEYRYGPPSALSSSSSRDYYPSSSSWASTSAAETSSTVAYANSDGRPYSYPHEHYKVAGSGARLESRNYETMNNYSWNSN